MFSAFVDTGLCGNFPSVMTSIMMESQERDRPELVFCSLIAKEHFSGFRRVCLLKSMMVLPKSLLSARRSILLQSSCASIEEAVVEDRGTKDEVAPMYSIFEPTRFWHGSMTLPFRCENVLLAEIPWSITL